MKSFRQYLSEAVYKKLEDTPKKLTYNFEVGGEDYQVLAQINGTTARIFPSSDADLSTNRKMVAIVADIISEMLRTKDWKTVKIDLENKTTGQQIASMLARHIDVEEWDIEETAKGISLQRS